MVVDENSSVNKHISSLQILFSRCEISPPCGKHSLASSVKYYHNRVNSKLQGNFNSKVHFYFPLFHWTSNSTKPLVISANPCGQQVFLVTVFPRTYFHLLLRKFSAGVRFQPTFSLSVHLWAQLHSLAVSDSSSHPQAAAHNSLLPFLFQHNPFTIHILFISRLSDLASQLCNCPGPGKQHFPNWLLNYCYFNSLEVVYPRYLVSIAVLLPIAFHFLQTKHLSWIYLYK